MNLWGVLSKQRRLILLQSEIVQTFQKCHFCKQSTKNQTSKVYSCGTDQLRHHFLGQSGRNGTTLTYAILLPPLLSERSILRKKGCELIFIASQRTANFLCPANLMVPLGGSTTVWWPPRRDRGKVRMHCRIYGVRDLICKALCGFQNDIKFNHELSRAIATNGNIRGTARIVNKQHRQCTSRGPSTLCVGLQLWPGKPKFGNKL